MKQGTSKLSGIGGNAPKRPYVDLKGDADDRTPPPKSSQKVQVRVVDSWSEDRLLTLITCHGRHIYLDEDETKFVRDELTKALRKFKRRSRV